MSAIYNEGKDVIGAAIRVHPEITIDWYRFGREFYRDVDASQQALFLASFSHEIANAGVDGLKQLAYIADSFDPADLDMVKAMLEALLFDIGEEP